MKKAVDRRDERGAVLVASLVLAVVLVIGAAAFLTHTSTEVVQVRRNIASTRAFYYAEAGINYAQSQVLRGWELSMFISPFYFLDYNTITTLPADMVVQAGTPEQGGFHVEIIDVTTPFRDARDVTVRSTGTYRGESRTVSATFCLELAASRAFDYTYFLNHWGWTQNIPSRFLMNGNIRANGYFSFSNSSLYVNGNPEYNWLQGEKLYKDSGGIYSGFRITGASSLNGMGKLNVNQHMNEDTNKNGVLDAGEDHNQDQKLTRPEHVEMPNLTDLNLYEEHARGWKAGAGGSIKIQGAGPGGTDLEVSDPIYGDEPGEKANLVVWGTEQNPIVVDGPVVIRGDLVMKGYVKGKGSLYVQGNVYIPDNVKYVNPPVGKPNYDYFAYSTPEQRSQAWQQASSEWRQQNADKDGLGLFARESVVIGNFQSSTWRSSVSTWLNNPSNESAEPVNGMDHMPNTTDQGEADGFWTVDHYTQDDLQRGLIPPGKNVGDPVPGSGEDIDGDGEQDPRISLSDFDFNDPHYPDLHKSFWGGWTPPELGWDQEDEGIAFSQLTNPNGGDALDWIDAFLYTNHATVANWGRNSPKIHLLGGIVSRVESIILRNDGAADWTHDERFTGGGQEFGFILPRVKKPLKVVHWAEVPADYALETP